MSKINIAVVSGGDSSEYIVSIKSGANFQSEPCPYSMKKIISGNGLVYIRI